MMNATPRKLACLTGFTALAIVSAGCAHDAEVEENISSEDAFGAASTLDAPIQGTTKIDCGISLGRCQLDIVLRDVDPTRSFTTYLREGDALNQPNCELLDPATFRSADRPAVEVGTPEDLGTSYGCQTANPGTTDEAFHARFSLSEEDVSDFAGKNVLLAVHSPDRSKLRFYLDVRLDASIALTAPEEARRYVFSVERVKRSEIASSMAIGVRTSAGVPGALREVEISELHDVPFVSQSWLATLTSLPHIEGVTAIPDWMREVWSQEQLFLMSPNDFARGALIASGVDSGLSNPMGFTLAIPGVGGAPETHATVPGFPALTARPWALVRGDRSTKSADGRYVLDECKASTTSSPDGWTCRVRIALR